MKNFRVGISSKWSGKTDWEKIDSERKQGMKKRKIIEKEKKEKLVNGKKAPDIRSQLHSQTSLINQSSRYTY